MERQELFNKREVSTRQVRDYTVVTVKIDNEEQIGQYKTGHTPEHIINNLTDGLTNIIIDRILGVEEEPEEEFEEPLAN